MEVIIQKGGAAGGSLLCNGRVHRWVYADHKVYGLPEWVAMGKCPNPEACKQKAAAMIQAEQDEAERLAAIKEPPKKG